MKEVKDLARDRKIILGMVVVPLLIFPLMGVALNTSTQAVKSSTSSVSFAVMNLDGGSFSQVALNYFSSIPNVTVKTVQQQPVTAALDTLKSINASTLLVIPPGFSSNITSGKVVRFDLYSPLSTFGLVESTKANIVSSVASSFGNYLTTYYIKSSSSGLDPSVVEHPLTISSSSYIHGQLVAVSPSDVNTQATVQSFTLPIATFIVIIFAMQIAATAIALEKEQKTLETLLTLPVSRFKILASKLVGSTIIAGLGAITSMIGFTYYMTSITNVSSGGASVAYVFSPPLSYYLFTGVLIFLTLTLATLVAIVVSAFAEDVRSAQALVGYLSLPVMLPAFFVLLGDFNSLPTDLRFGLLAFPFSYVAAFTSTGITGDFTLGVVGVAYIVGWILLLLYLAARFFRSERILTGKLSFRRKKRAAVD